MNGVPRKPKRVMLVVGEASGDLHGAHLVRALLQRDPALDIFGVAGEKIEQEGIRVVLDVASISGMGLAELVGNLKTLWNAYRLLQRVLKEERPNLLILIDFPEINMRLARLAKELQIPVLYYISPQVWAWRRRRIRKISRWVDRMAVVFPFEVPLYEREGVPVNFVGHPLLDTVHSTQPRERTLDQYGLDPSKRTIALLPGSRRSEVTYHLPPMIEAAEHLSRKMEVQFLLIRASTIKSDDLEEMANRATARISFSEGNTYNALNACDLAWAASGTVTLETALMLKPMIVVYRLAWLTYVMARFLVRVNYIGMVNIVAGERVVPELIQAELTAERIVRESELILRDSELRQRMIAKLAEVRGKLGSPGAAGRVADIALVMMN